MSFRETSPRGPMLSRGDLALYKCPCREHGDSFAGFICLVLEGPLRYPGQITGCTVGYLVMMEGTTMFFYASELEPINGGTASEPVNNGENCKGAEV